MVLCTLAMGLPVLLGALISYDVSYYFARIWNQLNITGLRFFCGVSWRVEGEENIPDKACIVMCKHQSTWETFFLAVALPRCVYVAKKSLVWIPIFGWAILALRFILIDRKGGRSTVEQMVEQSAQRLAEGKNIVIFPEGTRVAIGAEPNYRIGGAVVAERPLTLVSSGLAWGL